jgi:hypothetical protein
MGIELKKGENVFFPAPYVPSEPALIIVTDQRVVYFGAEGRQELDARKVSFVGRLTSRPFLVFCIVAALIGIPVAGYGAWLWYSVKDMKTFAESPPMTEEVDYEDPAITRIKALALAAVGGGLAVGAWFLIKKKRYVVICRGDDQLVRMRVKDELAQTQIVMTIQAMQKTVQAMQKPAAPAPAAKPSA